MGIFLLYSESFKFPIVNWNQFYNLKSFILTKIKKHIVLKDINSDVLYDTNHMFLTLSAPLNIHFLTLKMRIIVLPSKND